MILGADAIRKGGIRMTADDDRKSSRIGSVFRYVGVFIAGGFLVHALVMLINEATGFAHIHDRAAADRWIHLVFSASMVPMIVVYGALTAFCFAMYRAREQALAERERAHLEVERTASVIDTFAALSAVIIDLVATQNNRIISWTAAKERRGCQVSPAVKEASRNIARVLRELSMYIVELTPQERSEEYRARRHDILDHFVAQLEERTHSVVIASTVTGQNRPQEEVIQSE
jgi:Na+/phosphate symporter